VPRRIPFSYASAARLKQRVPAGRELSSAGHGFFAGLKSERSIGADLSLVAPRASFRRSRDARTWPTVLPRAVELRAAIEQLGDSSNDSATPRRLGEDSMSLPFPQLGIALDLPV
jgi:hypothetical protein